MSTTLKNSIWPNPDGNLGNIKVTIPTGIGNDEWPTGDAFIHDVVYKDGKISGYVDTKALLINQTGTTTMNYDYVEIELENIGSDLMTLSGPRSEKFIIKYGNTPKVSKSDLSEETKTKLKSAKKIINHKLYDASDNQIGIFDTRSLTSSNEYTMGGVSNQNIEVFDSDLSSLTDGYKMFYFTSLASFESNLPVLETALEMFMGCSNLASFNADMPKLTNGNELFNNCKSLTTFISDDLSSLKTGRIMFYNTALASFDNNLSLLTEGYGMFSYCENLSSFNSDLSSLIDGQEMFCYCTSLASFDCDMPKLENFTGMFRGCTNLTSFKSDLSSLTSWFSTCFSQCENLSSFDAKMPSLTSGDSMFIARKKLSHFSSDLSSLESAQYMFNSCTALNVFDVNLPSLKDGYFMFYGSGLSSLTTELPRLENGNYMFCYCTLDASSLKNIIDTINPNGNNGIINIGLGYSNSEASKLALAQEIGYNSWNDILAEFTSKNWSAQFEFNGPATMDLRNPVSTEIYAKLIEVYSTFEIDENGENIEKKPFYTYTSQDGSRMYLLEWYHDSNTTHDGFTLFPSLEDAIQHYNVVLVS